MDTKVFNRSDYVLELIAESIDEDPGDVADKLLATPELRRYVLIDTLAQTRASTVIAAVDRILARAVALKIHHTQEFFVRRQLMFGNRAMARLDHPNVVGVHDLGEHEGWLYSTLELCDTDLRAWAPARPWADVLERLIEAGRGLQAIHAEGLIHGDVKPANILIKGGVAKLGDLDLAAIDGGLAMWVRGSAGYVAPEVGHGLIEHASDVFGFACTVWTCLYRSPPFGASSGGDGELERLMELARVRAVLPAEIGPRMPDLTRSLLPALEPRPEDRMSLAELVELLVAERPEGARQRRLGHEISADAIWASRIVAPQRSTGVEQEREALVELLSRLVFVLMFAAECAGRVMPFIDLVPSPDRPGISSGAETVEFFSEDGAWFSRVLIAERRAQMRRVRPLPAKAKPAETELFDWASDIAREFIARRIGEQP